VLIFVTGATGFIGSYLVPELLAQGHRVRCLVRNRAKARALQRPGVELVDGDVTDKGSVLRGMAGCDQVIHLANLYSYWEPDNSVFRRVNVDGTRHVMEAALETGVKKVVHVSSVVVWGKSAQRPVTESTPEGPHFTEYGRTKYEGDQIVWQLHREKGLPVVVVYPTAVLGPGDDKTTGDYIQKFINRQLPGRVFENAVHTFIDVRDVARVIRLVAEREGNLGERYIAAAHRMRWGDFDQLLARVSGVPTPALKLPDGLALANAALFTWVADLVKRPPLMGMARDSLLSAYHGTDADGSKAVRELGIQYRPLEETVRDAIAWYRGEYQGGRERTTA
jgi:dihydroflavonol-4-reductase